MSKGEIHDTTAATKPATLKWKLETLGFHVLMIRGMISGGKIKLSFWDVPETEIIKFEHFYSVNSVNVGNVNAAVKAYTNHIEPSFREVSC